jgi:hypothetical protein
MNNVIVTFTMEVFPQNEWNSYLKAFNAQKCNRSTTDFPLWNRIKSPGIEIFVSWPKLSSNSPVKWSIKFEPVTRNEETLVVMDAILKDLPVFEDCCLEIDKEVE